jgi:hypothetical protein
MFAKRTETKSVYSSQVFNETAESLSRGLLGIGCLVYSNEAVNLLRENVHISLYHKQE